MIHKKKYETIYKGAQENRYLIVLIIVPIMETNAALGSPTFVLVGMKTRAKKNLHYVLRHGSGSSSMEAKINRRHCKEENNVWKIARISHTNDYKAKGEHNQALASATTSNSETWHQ